MFLIFFFCCCCCHKFLKRFIESMFSECSWQTFTRLVEHVYIKFCAIVALFSHSVYEFYGSTRWAFIPLSECVNVCALQFQAKSHEFLSGCSLNNTKIFSENGIGKKKVTPNETLSWFWINSTGDNEQNGNEQSIFCYVCAGVRVFVIMHWKSSSILLWDHHHHYYRCAILWHFCWNKIWK